MPQAKAVTDPWTGDRDYLIATIFPAEVLGPDHHEHAHHDGCYYTHEHDGGRRPHPHRYRCDGKNCNHGWRDA